MVRLANAPTRTSAVPALPALPVIALALLLASALGARGLAATGPWVSNDQARVRLVAARPHTEAPAAAVQALELGLEFELQSGWHVYWKNSGDAGYPPRIDLSRSSALAKATLLFPAPRRFDLPGGLVSFGYEDHVLYPLSSGLPVTSAPLAPVLARVDYLVCREECIPHTAELTVDVEAARKRSGPEGVATARRLAEAREALPADVRSASGAPQVTLRLEPGAAPLLVVEVATAGATLRAAAPDLFFENHPLFALSRPEMQATRSGLRFRVRLDRLDLSKPLPEKTDFAWTLTGFERSGSAGPKPVALTGMQSVALTR